MLNKIQSPKITGVGSALIDLLIHETDDFLLQIGKQKGGMTLVDDSYIEDILKNSSFGNHKGCPHQIKSSYIDEIIKKTVNQPIIVPGGATCNTIVGIGKLGGKSSFIGKRGDDYYGEFYEENLKNANVEPIFHKSSTPTGKVLSIITPDAQRSMFTCLGASTELLPDSITPEMFKDSGIAIMEGYLLFNPELMIACLKNAKQANAMIALDLASFEVVQASKNILNGIVKEYVDILIANEDEARAYTGCSDEMEALDSLAENVSIAVLKIGERGSYIAYKEEEDKEAYKVENCKNQACKTKDKTCKTKIIRINAKIGEPIKDTTGAGDLWAAGFLYGIANGYSIEKSGEIASACGYEVCQVIGAKIPEDGWQRIRNLLI
ncbi:MAG: adenosine kinase [Desulfamplus sp.]|nr:adenosine kinase [Desulfamplus sp.]